MLIPPFPGTKRYLTDCLLFVLGPLRGYPPCARARKREMSLSAPDKNIRTLRHQNQQRAAQLLARAKAQRIGVIIAESCTAGLLGLTLSDAPGAAEFFHGSFVTYTKGQKVAALGLEPALLRNGAVSCDIAAAMAKGALRHSDASLAAAITGVAGPDPDEDQNEVGRVCIAVATHDRTESLERRYGNSGRELIRLYAVADTLKAMLEAVTTIGEGGPRPASDAGSKRKQRVRS
jgi:nicotinamide-nucleotide amidase